MIRWCSYCRLYIGECEPWDDYQITHGVCQACFQQVLADIPPDIKAVQEISGFFRSVQRIARSGGQPELDSILRESRRLGIPPLDLMLGILQPLLVEIGALWVSGQVTAATEHRFSSLVGDLMRQVRNDRPGRLPSESPRLILFNAEGNEHSLGLMMAEYYFMACAVPALTVNPGVPVKEALDLLDFHKPKAVGFSVALSSQMAYVREVAGQIRGLKEPPRHILVGGPAVRMGLSPGPMSEIRVFRQLQEVMMLLDEDGS